MHEFALLFQYICRFQANVPFARFFVVVFEVMTPTVRIFVQLFEVTHIIPSPVQGHTINYPSATAASEMILARQIYASVIIKTT